MSGFVTVVVLIVLIWLTLRIHAEAEERRRRGASPDGEAPENIHYSSAMSWGRPPDHSTHHNPGHAGGSDSLGGGDGGSGGDGGHGG